MPPCRLRSALVRLRFRPAVRRARSTVISISSLSSRFAFRAPSAHLALQCPTVVVVLEDPRLATLRAPQVARDLTSVKCVCHSSHSARQASSAVVCCHQRRDERGFSLLRCVSFHTDATRGGKPSPLCFFHIQTRREGGNPISPCFISHRHNERGETLSVVFYSM